MITGVFVKPRIVVAPNLVASFGLLSLNEVVMSGV